MSIRHSCGQLVLVFGEFGFWQILTYSGIYGIRVLSNPRIRPASSRRIHAESVLAKLWPSSNVNFKSCFNLNFMLTWLCWRQEYRYRSGFDLETFHMCCYPPGVSLSQSKTDNVWQASCTPNKLVISYLLKLTVFETQCLPNLVDFPQHTVQWITVNNIDTHHFSTEFGPVCGLVVDKHHACYRWQLGKLKRASGLLSPNLGRVFSDRWFQPN